MSDLSPLCGHRTSGVQQQTQQFGLKPRADQHQICRARHQQRRDERIVQLFVGGFERRFHGGAKHQAILSLESRGLFLEDSGLVYDSTIHLSYCEPRLGQRVFQGVRVAFKFSVILKEAFSPAPFRNLLRGNKFSHILRAHQENCATRTCRPKAGTAARYTGGAAGVAMSNGHRSLAVTTLAWIDRCWFSPVIPSCRPEFCKSICCFSP